ncbi:helix-turn-helix domain-containing protein [Clostridium sp.]|uniref:helix-turn-helix domain-containing protein n=1 Tax=Clostridium sp. TaxID=1506 RepID=UPI002608D8CB|nr:helix-turn-helix domain-containing protein [Clostridium sp.]
MNLTKEKTILKLKEISEKYDIPINRLTSLIRQGKLKAVKSGKEYVVTLTEIHRYLGIETTSESLERELYIKELESKIKNYEILMESIKNCVSMIDNVITCKL